MKRFDVVRQWTWNLWSRFHGDVSIVFWVFFFSWDGVVLIPERLKLEYFLIAAGWEDKMKWTRPRWTPCDQLGCYALRTQACFVIPRFQQWGKSGRKSLGPWSLGHRADARLQFSLLSIPLSMHTPLMRDPAIHTSLMDPSSVALCQDSSTQKGFVPDQFEALRNQNTVQTVKPITIQGKQCFLIWGFKWILNWS